MSIPGAGLTGRAIAAVAEQAQKRVPAADLDERDPDYIRETLPRLWMLASLYFRADVRGLERIPEEGPVLMVGNHSGGNLTPDTQRLHARVQHLLRRRAPLPPARPQPRAVDARPGLAAQVRHGRRHARRTPSAPSTAAPRCSSTRAATTRSTGPSWESATVDFDGRKGFIRLAKQSERPDRAGGVGRRPGDRALPHAAARVSRKLLGLDRMFRLKVLPISLALPWVAQRRRHARPHPAAGQDHDPGAASRSTCASWTWTRPTS